MKAVFISLFIMGVSIACFGQKNIKRSILILSVDFYSSTFVAVPCDKFETMFKHRIKAKMVYSKDSIRALDKLLENLKFSDENKVPDTRAKIVFVNKLRIKEVICMDVFGVSVDGRLVEKNPVLFKFLLSLIPQKQLVSR